MPKDRWWSYTIAAAVLAVIGWIWALSNADMPDAVFFLTLALTIAAVALAAYAATRGRGTRAVR